MTLPLTPLQLLNDLETRGFAIRLNGEALRVVPASALTEEDRAAIRQHKAALVALVKLREYQKWTLCHGVDGRHARYLRYLHQNAQFLSGQHLTLEGEPMPRLYFFFDAGAAYRSEEAAEQRAKSLCAVLPWPEGETSTAAPGNGPVIVETTASETMEAAA